jgi:uncharacterized membrane protein YfcA
MTEYAVALALGFGAGTLSGLLGVGGAVLFIPALTLFLGVPQLHAHATSLAAMLLPLAVGAWRQAGLGNVRWDAAIAIGAISAVGVAGGVTVASALPEDVLRYLFAAFLVALAIRLVSSTTRLA